MAKKKTTSSKPKTSAPKVEAVSKPEIKEVPKAPEIEVKKLSKISSNEEAIAFVKERFKNSPGSVEYVVMENFNIFYGHSRAVAIRYAKDFDLRYFEVKA